MIFFLVMFLIYKSHFQILEEFHLFTICLLLDIYRVHDSKYITWVNTGMGKALSTLWNMSSVIVCNILPGSKWKINSLFQKHIHQSQEAIVFSLWVYVSLNLSFVWWLFLARSPLAVWVCSIIHIKPHLYVGFQSSFWRKVDGKVRTSVAFMCSASSQIHLVVC